MRAGATISTVVIVACCAVVFVQTALEGTFGNVCSLVSIVAMVVATLAFPVAWVALVVALASAPADERKSARRHVVVAAAAVVMLCISIASAIPQRVAFTWSRSAFDDLARELAGSAPGRSSAPRRVGLYDVDEWAVDASGGMYFRIGSSSLVDVTSWGFCIRPHPKTTPFGAAGYETTSMGGGWYWFETNDDWH